MRLAYAQMLNREPDLELCGMAEDAESAAEELGDMVCDVLITDLSLPGMDGITLVTQIRGLRPDLPTMVISAHEDAVFVWRAQRAGARAFLTKRSLSARLAPTIRHLMTSKAADFIAPDHT